MFQQIVMKILNIKFQQKTFSVCRAATCGRRLDETGKKFLFCDFLLRNLKWRRRGFSLVQAPRVASVLQTEQSKQEPYYNHIASYYRRSVGTTGHCLTQGTHPDITGFSGAGQLTDLETIKECKFWLENF
jgi:hypothetical protein